MTVQPKRRNPKHPPRPKRRRAASATQRPRLRQCVRTFRAVCNVVLGFPPIIRAVLIGSFCLLLWLSVNWAVQAVHKPSEMLFPLEASLQKSPRETWMAYESLFREHATAVITPEFLAGLAQAEGGGNPVARTYWRWQLSWNPLEWYQPASSAVGMYQLTNGTFLEARRYCIHDHVVVEEGPWHDLYSCWFNALYTRVIPSHAIELTAAFLDRRVAETLGPRAGGTVTLQQKHNLAAVIHLCGGGAGRDYAARGLQLTANQRCGDHDVQAYLAKLNVLKQTFATLPKRDKSIRQAR